LKRLGSEAKGVEVSNGAAIGPTLRERVLGPVAAL
jgi:hypothetical protein